MSKNVAMLPPLFLIKPPHISSISLNTSLQAAKARSSTAQRQQGAVVESENERVVMTRKKEGFEHSVQCQS
jgi:hypothetical protein